MFRSILKTLLLLRIVFGASACLQSVRMRTRAGSRPLYSEKSNGRLYRSPRVCDVRCCFVALIVALLAVCAPSRAQTPGVMPTVTPVSVQPIGPASGGGVLTRVTYEMRLAANDASVAAAANDARYVTRAVTIAGPTMGGIVRGVVAGGSRLVPWIAAAATAYELYKWYTDSQGQLTAPAVDVPAVACGSTGYWQYPVVGGTSKACSFPGAVRASLPWAKASYGSGVVISRSDWDGVATIGRVYFKLPNGSETSTPLTWFKGLANDGVTDPAYQIPPSPVTDAQLGDLSQQHPEWWPDMLRDPLTQQPLITPEIADDMNALKHELAPQYGVDPTTLPQTTPDPNYQEGTAQPRPQSLPPYCAWAQRACEHYDFVEKNWPFAVPPDLDDSKGPDDPADSAFSQDDSTGLENLDSTGFLGGGSCPGFPPVEYLGQNIMSSDGICRTAGILGAWLEGIAYAIAAMVGLRLKAGG